MNNLLELNLNQNPDAAALASPYENVDDRKEIYLKYLIVSALKEKTGIVDIVDSLFYGRRFYSLTRLFDFYVNNNVFDLIILKPDSDEMLFDVLHDDIHANIYGYAVARVSHDFKTAKIEGYFLAKDFSKVVKNNTLAVSMLREVNGFEDIEILDSQMSLSDVSDRFFELMSEFLDEEIREDALSELACLLYNSAELREVFAEIGRFDRVCLEIQNNTDLLTDEFLNILGGDRDESIVEDESEYFIDDLESLSEETQAPIEAEDIDLGFDLESLSGELEEENEIVNMNESEQEQVVNDNEAVCEIADEQELVEDLSDDELVLVEEDSELAELAEALVADEEVVVEEQTDSSEMNFALDEIVEPSADEDLILEELSGENTDEISPSDVNPNNLEYELEVVLSGDESENTGETSDIEEESLLADDTDELYLEFDGADLDSLEDISEEDSNIGKEKEKRTSSLAAELAALNEKKENVIQDSVEPELEIILPDKDVENKLVALSDIVDDELLRILNDGTVSVDVDDSEVLKILGIEPVESAVMNESNVNISEEVIDYQEEQAPQIEDAEIMAQYDSYEEGQAGETIELLYNDEENVASVGTFPGGGIVSDNVKIRATNSGKKGLFFAVALLAVLVMAGMNFFTNGKNAGTSDVVADLPRDITPKNNDDFSIPPAIDTQAGMPSAFDESEPVAQSAQLPADTKIVTSLSQQAGAAPVILRSVAWQIPTSIASDKIFNKYLQIAGKNIKANLATDLLETDDFAYNNKIKVSMTVKNNTPVKNIKIVESSGSKGVDDLVLQSIKQTLKYINTPVMSSDTGDREVVLVISI